MAQAIRISRPTYEPVFDISENMAPDIVGVKRGQEFQMIMNYEVIEKTKSFTMLRINSLSLNPSRRKF